MSPLQHKALGRPDEIRPFEGGGQTEIFEIADSVIGRMVMEPGWTWQKNVRPIAGTEHCLYHHLGYVLTGELGVRMDVGTEAVFGPHEMFDQENAAAHAASFRSCRAAALRFLLSSLRCRAAARNRC